MWIVRFLSTILITIYLAGVGLETEGQVPGGAWEDSETSSSAGIGDADFFSQSDNQPRSLSQNQRPPALGSSSFQYERLKKDYEALIEKLKNCVLHPKSGKAG